MIKGRVINLNGGVYKVELEDSTIIQVRARGKLRADKVYQQNIKSESRKKVVQTIKSSPKVGDIVVIENDMIDHFLERKNSLIRPDIANVDQILLVFALREPDFSYYLLDLFILNVIKNNIKPIIILTKIDKLTKDELFDVKVNMSYYERLGYPVYYVNSIQRDGVDLVKSLLKDKITILSGQTGAGKSSLINAIMPGFDLKTQEISNALGRGKHTTREISLYPISGGYIGDTPGFSKLDALGIEKGDLNQLFVEFKGYKCKFKDCEHLESSLGCGVYEAYKKGEILSTRYLSYIKLKKELKR